ncbi:hypothetical protein NL676_039278 [Syzygium grande]|nr:hypothetical protein NL676_039278 [Syzygium grande]
MLDPADMWHHVSAIEWANPRVTWFGLPIMLRRIMCSQQWVLRPPFFATKTALHSILYCPTNHASAVASTVSCRRGINGSNPLSNELELNFHELHSHFVKGSFSSLLSTPPLPLPTRLPS